MQQARHVAGLGVGQMCLGRGHRALTIARRRNLPYGVRRIKCPKPDCTHAFSTAAARLAFAALVLAVLTAAAAVAGVRLGTLSDASGSTLMIPATVLGAVALVLALLWLRAALTSNLGAGKRLGLTALIGALVFLYPPLSYVYAGFVSLPIHDATTDPEDPPQFVALAKIRSRQFAASSMASATSATRARTSPSPMPCMTNIRP